MRDRSFEFEEEEERTTLLEPRALLNFVETDSIRDTTDRALTYLAVGFPVHLRGAAGTGKTTLAMHIAAKLGRPVVMVHGDDELSGSDLVGAEHGYYARKVVDNYIHSVLKKEEEVSRRWVDNRLTVAAKRGYTLVYDEFTRSRPEANNVLLAVLQERLLDLQATGSDTNYVRVDPAFNAIFTSNPGDYAGVHRSQDALLDRMVTIDLGHFDEVTETAITQARAQIGPAEALRIVGLIRALREANVCDVAPTVRSCIKLGRAVRLRNASFDAGDPRFRQICLDILVSGSIRDGIGPQAALHETLDRLITELCPDEQPGAVKAAPTARTGRSRRPRTPVKAAKQRGVA